MRRSLLHLRHYSVHSNNNGCITSGEFSARRQRLVEGIKREYDTTRDRDIVVLIKGSTRSYIGPDVPSNYRQCSHFRYLTGVTVPGCVYLMHVPQNGRPSSWLFMDGRTAHEELWDGELPDQSSLMECSGADEILPTQKLQKQLHRVIAGSHLCFEPQDNWSPDVSILATEAKIVNLLKKEIDKLRLTKSASEQQIMGDVCEKGGQMMGAVLAGSRGAKNENHIWGRIEYEARFRNAERLAYPPVIAGGERATIIHYMDNAADLIDGDCVLIDAGLEKHGYVSDITRCFPVSGYWTDPQRVLYEALNGVQYKLLEYANNNQVRLSDLYTKMIEFLAVNLVEAGVLRDSIDDKHIVRVTETLCPHHVSHYLGMDVHDCETVSKRIALPPGVPFTIEPGVYIPQRCSEYVREEFVGLGFRIEDDVMTTENGIRVLSEHCERDSEGIESIMNG